MVVSSSVIIMNIVMEVCALLLPTVGAIICRKKFHAQLKSFWIGCAVWFVFVVVLENVMHTTVLQFLPIGQTIQGNIWLYALYAGLAAGIFEETGRFLAMKTILRRQQDNPYNGLMYGVGHGGFEAFYLLSSQAIMNLFLVVMIHLDIAEPMLNAVSGEQQEVLRQAFDAVVSTPANLYVLAPVERISAMIFHIAASVLVWIAVTKKKTYLYPLAIFLHFLFDACVVVINSFGINLFLLEGIIFVMAVAVAGIAFAFWKGNKMAEAKEE